MKREAELVEPRTPKRQNTLVIESSQSPEVLVHSTPCKAEPRHSPDVFSRTEEIDDLVEGNTTIVSTNITESPSKTDLLGRDENQTDKEARINELREQYSKDLGRVKFWKDPSMIEIPVGMITVTEPRPFLIRRYGNPPSPVSQCKKRIDQLADTLYDSNLRCEALSLNLQAASYALESAERERDRAVEEHTKLRKEVVGLHCELRRLQDRIKTGGWDLIRLSDSVDIV
ncbi:hypothetical protein D9758_017288 [Tetrapyrgos nigripes]|uniref:Uncharacterized protein n=1 Tax=Tetrapyrgos nigripes TaxID=182062 RepID=A0A8H5FEL7_9AGAR|nr:hypothetical protein D9758_017288 [Tetrapyrgos nigripes]